jgi:Zn-dependent M16 (insulinase) family peptidase
MEKPNFRQSAAGDTKRPKSAQQPESAPRPESDPRPESALQPLAFLEDFSGPQLAWLLRDESPAAAALILSRLPPRLAADALAAGTAGAAGTERMPEIVRRIARPGEVSPEVLERAAAGLREKARRFRGAGGGPEGVGALLAILRSAGASFGDRLLQDLEAGHPALGRELRDRIRALAAADEAAAGIPEAFDLLELRDLPELKALGIYVRHRKSGAGVFHILNEDPENLFAFATAPEDDTGAAHILEHSVLCGSERYPLKDAFLVLAQGSLQTFLNAWTFPDKTVYPASSVNERDYFNLMSVYGDAVFRPLLSEWTFMQEGHRLSFSSGEEKDTSGSSGGGNPDLSSLSAGGGDGLSVTGVVYNEMKGAFSSLDRYAVFWSTAAVLDGTPYVFESGGDPDAIPGLTLEGLREFHRRRYSPANCRIFLAGNIPTARQLAFLDEKFLSLLPPGEAAEPVSPAPRRRQPKTVRVPCPAGAETKSTVLLSWLCADSTDPAESMALACLTEILLGHDGSPLTRALVESGLGEDLSPASGLEGELRETVFCAGLRGVAGGAAEVEALVMGELRRLVREGIPAAEIEAALLSMEFAHREIRRSGGPWSLTWLRRSLQGWLYGAKPWDRLLFVPAMAALKARLAGPARVAALPPEGGEYGGEGGETGGGGETAGGRAGSGYFESLIGKYLVDNPHRALVILEPQADFLEKKEAALKEGLAGKAASLSGEERRGIQEKARRLEELQGAPETAEALAAIPHLSRKDLSPEIDTPPEALHDAGGLPVLTHETFTNGISYADLAFPLDIFSPERYPWFPLFARVIFSLGLPGMDYGEVSGLLARTSGGQSTLLETGSLVRGASRSAVLPGGIFDLRGRDWLVFRLKALDEKLGPSLDLIRRLIVEADFSDRRRIRDLVLEMKNDLDSSLAPGGHSYAAGRAGRPFSRSRRVDERWNGLSQIDFVHRIAAMEIDEVAGTLTEIRDTLRGAGLVANLTGSAGTLGGSLTLLKDRFGEFGPPKPAAGTPGDFPEGPLGPEVYLSPSLRVGFAAAAFSAAPFDSPGQAAELALAHQLSTGALWESIRMKGGAYGAFAHPDHLEEVFSLATYRDPSPLKSLDSFRSILKEASEAAFVDEGELEKTIIGAYAGETHPRTGAEKAFTGFLRFLYGIEDIHRRRKLERLIAVTGEQVTEALRRLAAQSAAVPVILAGPRAAEKAAKALGVEVRELPV